MASASRWLRTEEQVWLWPDGPASAAVARLSRKIGPKDQRFMKEIPNRLSKRTARADADPETIAIQALTFMTQDPDRASRFFAASGFSPVDLRAAALDPAFLAGVLDLVMADEPLLLAFAAGVGHTPEAVVKAHGRLTRNAT